jgi:hypothetical protein
VRSRLLQPNATVAHRAQAPVEARQVTTRGERALAVTRDV